MQGKIKWREHEIVGLQNAPRALLSLFEGENIGKVIVRVASEKGDSRNVMAKL